jgi:TetR/AcrR family transcriptional regulator
VGIRRSSLLHHFPSKDALYRVVMVDACDQWSTALDGTSLDGQRGFAGVEGVLRLAFCYFEQQPILTRLARRAALDGGPVGPQHFDTALRPRLEQAVSFLDTEMDAGRLRRYDARQLVCTAYGAVLSYLNDAPLISILTEDDPLSHDGLAERRDHLLDVLGHALKP